MIIYIDLKKHNLNFITKKIIDCYNSNPSPKYNMYETPLKRHNMATQMETLCGDSINLLGEKYIKVLYYFIKCLMFMLTLYVFM